MTRLEQLQKSGIGRVGTPTRGFKYKSAGGTRVTAADLKRIDELKIPPAWSDAWINAAAGGAVQAIGRDAAGRLQSLYHANHVRRQEASKFRRLIKFGEALPKLRTAVASHIKQPGLGREPVMAAMLRILATCFLRPGSQVYASENGSFGLATLQADPHFGRSSRKNESSSSLEAALANPAKLPCSIINLAARMNAPQAVRASAPPTLTRRTPSAEMSCMVSSLAQLAD